MANVSSSNGLEKRPKLRFPGFDEPWRDVHLFDVVNLRRERARSSKEVYVSTENLLQNFILKVSKINTCVNENTASVYAEAVVKYQRATIIPLFPA